MHGANLTEELVNKYTANGVAKPLAIGYEPQPMRGLSNDPTAMQMSVMTEEYRRQFDESRINPDNFLRNLDEPRALDDSLALESERPSNVYLTQLETDKEDPIYNEAYHVRDEKTGRPMIDITKYNYKIQELEKLRQEALKDCQEIEDELGKDKQATESNQIELLERQRKERQLELRRIREAKRHTEHSPS